MHNETECKVEKKRRMKVANRRELRANNVLKLEHQTISRQSLNLSGFHKRCHRLESDNFNCGGRIVYLQWKEKKNGFGLSSNGF